VPEAVLQNLKNGALFRNVLQARLRHSCSAASGPVWKQINIGRTGIGFEDDEA